MVTVIVVVNLKENLVSKSVGYTYINTFFITGNRVWSDKYRTGIITIVLVRTASIKIEKYG